MKITESCQNGPFRTAFTTRDTNACPLCMSVGGCSSFSFCVPNKPKLGSTNATCGSGAYAWRSASLRQKHEKGQEMRVHARPPEQPEARSLRRILKIVGPADSILIQQVKNRSADRLISSRRRKLIVCAQMSK